MFLAVKCIGDKVSGDHSDIDDASFGGAGVVFIWEYWWWYLIVPLVMVVLVVRYVGTDDGRVAVLKWY